MAPFVAEIAVACVDIGRPGLDVLATDDVDDATHGIRAVEG